MTIHSPVVTVGSIALGLIIGLGIAITAEQNSLDAPRKADYDYNYGYLFHVQDKHGLEWEVTVPKAHILGILKQHLSEDTALNRYQLKRAEIAENVWVEGANIDTHAELTRIKQQKE